MIPLVDFLVYLVALIVFSLIYLPIRKLWYRSKSRLYDRDAVIEDFTVILLLVSASSIYVSLLPVIDMQCWATSTKQFVAYLRLIPVLLLVLFLLILIISFFSSKIDVIISCLVRICFLSVILGAADSLILSETCDLFQGESLDGATTAYSISEMNFFIVLVGLLAGLITIAKFLWSFIDWLRKP